jgi:hypothetical protein
MRELHTTTYSRKVIGVYLSDLQQPCSRLQEQIIGYGRESCDLYQFRERGEDEYVVNDRDVRRMREPQVVNNYNYTINANYAHEPEINVRQHIQILRLLGGR